MGQVLRTAMVYVRELRVILARVHLVLVLSGQGFRVLIMGPALLVRGGTGVDAAVPAVEADA